MTQISSITDRDVFGPPPVSAGYKVDISRGERIGRVSSEWFSRPDDERYLSLSALYAAVRARAYRATARTVETRTLRVEASRDNAERLALIVPGREEPIAPTHWSFGQMCSLVGAPAGYMRQLPAPLAGINMQHGLLSHRADLTVEEWLQWVGLDIALSTWSSCEGGHRLIQVSEASYLCTRPGVTLEWIYRGNENHLPRDILDKLAAVPVAPPMTLGRPPRSPKRSWRNG